MDDGVASTPPSTCRDGTPPAAGWPAIMMFHGLGGAARHEHARRDHVRTRATPSDVRRSRARGLGRARLAGRAARDRGLRTEFAWLAAQPAVDDTQIGAWGISLGGGAVWDALVAGVPFEAAEMFETWSDLYQALAPKRLGKSERSSSSSSASRPTGSTPLLAIKEPRSGASTT